MADNRARGLYPKYRVERLNGQAVGAVFVLEFDDPNCWPALRAYADTVKNAYPVLATDILLAVDAREHDSWRSIHIGRSFPGIYHVEENCPCPQLPCGLVEINHAVEIDCPEHNPVHAKTFRSNHRADQCPGVRDE